MSSYAPASNPGNLQRSRKNIALLTSPDDMEALNVKFVRAVEKHRVLYDFTLTEYSRKEVTEKAWHQVALEVNLSEYFGTVNECKQKWKNLRTAFLRRLKAPPCGSGLKTKKSYYLHEALQFVLPYTKAINPTTGDLPENPQRPEVTNNDDLDSEVLHSRLSCPGPADCDRPSPSPSPPSPSPSTSAAPTLPLITSITQCSMPLDHVQSRNTVPESKQLPQSGPYPISQKQPSGKKRKIPISESDTDRALTEYFATKQVHCIPKTNERKEFNSF